jgi:hypothetical protein
MLMNTLPRPSLYQSTNTVTQSTGRVEVKFQKSFDRDENKQQGRQLAYLNAYEHQGQPRFTAIWNSATKGSFKARHGLSGGQYQQEWEAAVKTGMLTRAVTGYVEGTEVRYAAVWRN